MTFNGSLLSFAIDNHGEGFKLSAAGAYAPELIFDSNRSSAGDDLAKLAFNWNNTEVALITAQAGADTTNKDDGKLLFYTRPSGSAAAVALTLDSSQNATFAGTCTATTFSGSGASLTNLPLPSGGTFSADVTFTGDNYNLVWDKSDNAFEFGDSAKAAWGADQDLTIHHGGDTNLLKNYGKTFEIRSGSSGNDTGIRVYSGGAIQLAHNGTVKLTTGSSGVNISGTCSATSFSGSGASLTGVTISSDAQNNTLVGSSAGQSFSGTNAEKNTLVGKEAGQAITTGDKNTALGYRAMYSINTGSDNTYLGHEAGEGGQDKIRNVYVGSGAGKNNSGADTNVGIGYNALGQQATGSSNVGIGNEAGIGCSTNSQQNVIVGHSSGSLGTNSNYNVNVGAQSMQSCDGVTYNVAVGYQALKGNSMSGDGNVGLGYRAGYKMTSGDKNVCIGYNCGPEITTADSNVFIGNNAGYSASSAAGSVCIGEQADPNDGNENIAIGHNAVCEQFSSDQITLGHTNITSFRIPGINFYLKDNGGTASEGQVLTADANGKGYWADASGGGGSTPAVKTSNYTASSGDYVFVNASGLTITLPSSPSAGDNVKIRIIGTNYATIARNSSNIESAAENFYHDLADKCATFTYANSSLGWQVGC